MSLKKNVFSNFLGQGWTALMGLAFIPFYIRLMGVESYGVVGVFVSLQMMFAVLDLGLSQTLAREMARLSVDRKNAVEMANTARTLEVVYWGAALVVVMTMALLSHFIAYYWLNPVEMTQESLRKVFWIMALVLGFRWPVALYMGGLNGLQQQVLVNVLLALFATFQGLGALAVLWTIEPTVEAFFLWQALVALLQVAVFRIALWRSLSTDIKPAFRRDVLSRLWRFAAGMSGISLLATILTQLDKILLSKMLSLVDFGYYIFAATVAGGVYKLIGPIFTAYYPRLTELVSKNDMTGLVRSYHQGSQLMAVVIIPISLVLVFFSRDILTLWTGDAVIVENTYFLVSLLVIGNALNGLMNLPYALQLAYGWTKLAFCMNTAAVIILVPAIYYSTNYWGVVGAASVWIVLNSTYLLVGVQLMHRRLIKDEKWRWYSRDVVKLLSISLIVTLSAKVMMPESFGAIETIAALIFVWGMSTLAALVFAETLRKHAFSWPIFRVQ